MKKILAILLIAIARAALADDPAAIGATRIARWKDDCTAAFLLMFDDGCPSHWQVAIPELAKRGMIGTFYLNPGKAEFTKFSGGWETNYWKQGMAYAVHTMTHKGVHNIDEAEREIGDCAAIIRKILPGTESKLLSYGQPGVAQGCWEITTAQLNDLLTKHHLITRGEISGHMAVYHLKTTAELLAMADKAITNRSLEFIVFHGIERIVPNWSYQDFWAIKQSIFLPFLDGLQQRRDRHELWITGHITAHQYATERDAAQHRLLTADARSITLDLTSTTDPRLYDQPLTLITTVPPAWKQCLVQQGTNRTNIAATAGQIQYPAIPNAGPITIRPR